MSKGLYNVYQKKPPYPALKNSLLAAKTCHGPDINGSEY